MSSLNLDNLIVTLLKIRIGNDISFPVEIKQDFLLDHSVDYMSKKIILKNML